ncbi:hypothetical protein [Paenibacillus elgii]|uniref:hypothetical protein n=1 Tax=Paenibacillus elgii TaxID=189691 RepID=UPI00203A4021|nr:hypothetical protein [Paenibacillus elgii]MCM3274197.1 hypothetical protein [Paenibacillus elgii]
MSTNYYLRNQEEYSNHKTIMEERNRMIEQIMKQLQEWNTAEDDLYDIKFRIENVANVGYEEFHIGKRSRGWKPLFEKQKGMFTSVKELKEFYVANANKYEIVDEYGTVLTWDELKKELIDWNGERENGDRSDNYTDSEGYTWARYQFS